MAERALSAHPAIVGLDESGTTATGLPYVVMEFMEGGSLADHLAGRGRWRGRGQSTSSPGWPMRSITLTGSGVLHRNIKPANILLSGIGIPKLADFWIDASFGETPGTAAAQAATLEHTAPEVLDGRPPTAAADVYSLASTLFALLAGQAPFPLGSEESVQSLVARVTAEPVPDLRSRGIPAAVCEVLEQALARDPAGRPASAADFAYLLRRAARLTARRSCGPAPQRQPGPPSRQAAKAADWCRPRCRGSPRRPATMPPTAVGSAPGRRRRRQPPGRPQDGRRRRVLRWGPLSVGGHVPDPRQPGPRHAVVDGVARGGPLCPRTAPASRRPSPRPGHHHRPRWHHHHDAGGHHQTPAPPRRRRSPRPRPRRRPPLRPRSHHDDGPAPRPPPGPRPPRRRPSRSGCRSARRPDCRGRVSR